MTQEKLINKLKEAMSFPDEANGVLHIINQHVKEVIGDDEKEWESGMGIGGRDLDRECRNELKSEQRKRAGL